MWEDIRLWLAASGSVFSALGLLWAVNVFRTSRRDQRLRDAAGLHAEMYEQAQELPTDWNHPDEPGMWDETEVIIRLRNNGPHAFYSVMASVWMPAQQVRLCAYADVVGPGAVLYARVGQAAAPGCDAAGRQVQDAAVRLTFRDGLGKAWLRVPDGRLTKASRRAQHAALSSLLLGRVCPAVGLHSLDSEGFRDWDGHEVEIEYFEPDAQVRENDQRAIPPHSWTKEELDDKMKE